MKRLTTAAAIATVMAMAGCTGSGNDEATVITDPTTTTETVTTEQATTTTEATTTTVDQTAAVEAAYLRSHDVWVECHQTLPECDVETAFSEVFTGGSYERLVAATLERQADGLVYEPPDIEEHSRTEVFDVSVDPSQTSATVTYCTYSGGKELSVSDDGTRTPIGLNNTVLVSWGTAEFVFENDGQWRVEDLVGDAESPKNILIEDVDRLRSEGELCGGR